jgi:5'(3')-deoxyribonucleotidase
MEINIDMDDTLFQYSKARALALHEEPTQAYPQAQYGFFLNLELIDGAKYAYDVMIASGHDVSFVTAPSILNPWSYTEKRLSIEKHFGLDACYKLIIAYDKSIVRGDVLIDDGVKHNQDKFKGYVIRFGSVGFQNWHAVLDRLDALSVHIDGKYLVR